MRTNFRIPAAITFSILTDMRRPLLAQERGVIEADGVPSALTIQCYVVRICWFDCSLLLSTRSFTQREASREEFENPAEVASPCNSLSGSRADLTFALPLLTGSLPVGRLPALLALDLLLTGDTFQLLCCLLP